MYASDKPALLTLNSSFVMNKHFFVFVVVVVVVVASHILLEGKDVNLLIKENILLLFY